MVKRMSDRLGERWFKRGQGEFEGPALVQRDSVLGRPILQPRTTLGGIMLPDKTSVNTSIAVVMVSTMEGLRGGDVVYYTPFGGVFMEVEGQMCVVLTKDDILIAYRPKDSTWCDESEIGSATMNE
jgi:co-chaperonin GroES (HSP10)